MSDWYIQDKSRLKGAPKFTIGRYVSTKGIATPLIFDSFEKAVASGLPIIGRSEHQQEYDGASGILESHLLEYFDDVSDANDFRKQALDRERSPIDRYCNLTGEDRKKFVSEINYSFWEKLDGFNRTVTADNSIQGRYHITTKSRELSDMTIIEDGKIIRKGKMPLPQEIIEGFEELVDFYERVRNLEHFDRNHCPIIEVQTTEEGNFFLQYHRNRDFVAAEHVITEIPNGYMEVPFVRGATKPEGELLDVSVVNGPWAGRGEWPDKLLEEQASCDQHYAFVYSELMVRRRILQILPSCNVERTLLELGDGHVERSKWFKPQVSVMMDISQIVSEGEWETFEKRVQETHEDQYVKVHLISDGRRAVIKRV